MAVNIDTVYQRVLAMANKEQRGYITPQEFNLHANQAQMNIFEQYFYDTHQFQATQKGNSSEYSDMIDLLSEKITPFEKYKIAVSMSGNTGTLATDLYRLGTVFYAVGGTTDVEVERVEKNDFTSVLLNQYRNGMDSNGWHSDDEKELGKHPIIASVSFGEERYFYLKHKTHKEERLKIKLGHGSLLIMGGTKIGRASCRERV